MNKIKYIKDSVLFVSLLLFLCCSIGTLSATDSNISVGDIGEDVVSYNASLDDDISVDESNEVNDDVY